LLLNHACDVLVRLAQFNLHNIKLRYDEAAPVFFGLLVILAAEDNVGGLVY